MPTPGIPRANLKSMKRRNAFTLTELLMVVGIIAVLAALLLPALSSASHKSRQTTCFNNLHQIGIGFTSFSVDHEGKYPMQLPSRLEGSMEFNRAELITNTEFSRAFQHFAALSNHVPNVKVMTCPADRRKPALNYATFSGTNLSYWVNPNATPHATLSLLAGDWNLTGATQDVRIQPTLSFNKQVHRWKGSVLFADGRVELTRSFAYNPVQPPVDNTAASSSPPSTVTPNSQLRPTPVQPSTPHNSISTPGKIAQGASARIPTNAGTNQITTNKTAVTNYAAGAVANAALSKPSKISQPNTSREPAPPRASSVTTRARGAGSPEASDDEPWDTSGFRLFKFLAVASYLISLLWAILALLMLYLKSRFEQRRRQQPSAFGQN
jgi:prepilin-type N-terminal cleavage/methylation domain-containing protein